jgi:hypothetical protein
MPLRFSLLALCIGMASAPAYGEDEAAEKIWVEQHAKTADFAFLVQLTQYDELHAPHAIKVVERKTGTLVQLIDNADGIEMSREPANFLHAVDVNADGHPDLRLAVNNGGAGPNSMDNFYLFDPATRQFIFHAGLSDLSQVSIGPNGTITSSSRGGCCHHGSETYRIIRGRLVQLSSRAESLAPDGKWITLSIGTLRAGKMRYTSSRRRAPPGY